ncbi:MAG: hypothetical protein ACFFCS_10605 [Candidatus Hodarchaeota archaeon]
MQRLSMSTTKQSKKQCLADQGPLQEVKDGAMQGEPGEKTDRLRGISNFLLELSDIMVERGDMHSAIDFYEGAMKAERDAGTFERDLS